MTSAVTNRGTLLLMIFVTEFNVQVFLRALKCLIRRVKGRVFLITDHVRGYLRITQRQPLIVKAHFQGQQVQYAMP